MTANYRLASLDVSSIYEAPAVPLEVPGQIETGTDPRLAILEGGFRSPSLACRFTFPTGLVGVQLPPGALPERLQVSVQVRMDRTADERWTTRAARIAETEVTRGIASTRSLDPSGRHRLVLVWLQGHPRAMALLAAGPEGKGVRQRLVLDLPTSELDESRLLLLSFTAGTSPWNTSQELDECLIGVSLPHLQVSEPDPEVQATVSTGTPAQHGYRSFSPEIGFAVVNPVSDAEPTRLEIQAPATGPGPHLLRGRRGRAGRPVGVEAEVRDVHGQPLQPLATTQVAPDRFELVLPGHDGPLQLRLTAPGEAGPTVPYAIRALPRR